MSEPAPAPPSNLGADRKQNRHRDGRLLVGSGAMNLLLTLVVVGLLLVVANVTSVNAALVDALSQQRSQFEACEGKPVGTRGCTQPVAAEPSVILRQGKTGAIGLPGADGRDGRDGVDGSDGKPGRDGTTPPCMKTPRQCVGADGKPGLNGTDGKPGKDGTDGADGKDGITPACWFEESQCRGAQGPQGEMGVQGPKGVGTSSTQCVDDDTPNGSHWLITYSDGTQETSPGPCRTKLP